MIRLSLTRADATVTETETLTAGRVGLECAFAFNSDWDGLEKVAVFEGAETIEVALGTANVAVVPPECMATAGYNLRCGAYGMSASRAIVIPTIWAKAGKIKDSASPDESLADFTPTLAAQVIAKANSAEETANSIKEQAARGEFDGFSPYVGVTEIENGHRVSITDSVGTNEFDVMNGRDGADAPGGDGLTEDVKQALLQLAQKVAYIDAQGQTYYQDLYDALYPSAVLTSITAVYTQSGTVYNTDSLDSLRPDIVVTAHYDDNTSEVITNYTLSGDLTVGTSTITASYQGKTATFNVTVTRVASTFSISNNLTGCTTSNSASTVAENASYNATITANTGYTLAGATVSITMVGLSVTGYYSNGTISIPNVTGDVVITVVAVAVTVSSISAVFNQGSNVIYDTDSLDTIKQYLVVTAHYNDSTTETIPSTDYTLSGTLTEGTSTITVAYGGKTTTFNVTVTGWNNYEYSMSNGQIVKIVGATSGAISAIPGGIELDSNSTNRRSYPITKIGVRPYQEKTQSFADTIYYPIPIPADAVKAVVSITPSTQFHGESMYTYADGSYTRRLDPGWKQGSFTHSFTAGQYDYITIVSKYNSAGSSYPEEPTEVSIQFLTE